MECTIDNLALKGDRVLVRKVLTGEKIGRLYVPDTVRYRRDKRRKDAWKGEVISLGDMVDSAMLRHSLKKGDIVYCEPVSLDCPSFRQNGDVYVIITDEDIIGLETQETQVTQETN